MILCGRLLSAAEVRRHHTAIVVARQVLKEEVADFLARLTGVYNPQGNNPVELYYGRELPV